MDTKRLLILTALAALTLACWSVGNDVLSPDSRLFSVIVTLAHPASIIFGAGALLARQAVHHSSEIQKAPYPYYDLESSPWQSFWQQFYQMETAIWDGACPGISH